MRRSIFKSVLCLLVVIPIIITMLLLLQLHPQRTSNNESVSVNNIPLAEEHEPKTPLSAGSDPGAISLKLTLLGDIMCHPTQYAAAQTGEDYDFHPSFSDISPFTSSADLTLANLETTLAGKSKMYSGYPSFNTPEQLALAIKDTLGVDILSTANNHSLDRLYSGLCTTIDYLEEYGLEHTGTYKTKEDANQILIQDVNSLKIAFLSYTYGTNGITLPSEKRFAVNYINRDKIKQDAQKARELGADLIIASLHWGQEYSNTPSSEQTELAKWLFSHTEVNIISGNHVHTIQPIEFIRVPRPDKKKEKEGLVIYAQGNFISDQQTESANMGIVVNLDIRYNKVTRTVNVASVDYFPSWVDETPGAGLKSYRVLHMEKALKDFKAGSDPLLSNEDYEEMQLFKVLVKDVIANNERIHYLAQ